MKRERSVGCVVVGFGGSDDTYLFYGVAFVPADDTYFEF